MQKITTHLWFDKEAIEAANFYISLFDNSRIKSQTVLENTPSGDCDIINLDLAGQGFTLINAGPYFKFNPSISFLVACKTQEEVEDLWRQLSPGGKVMMELGQYPFSEKYGWLEDKYGLSWQVMYMGEREIKQQITPTLMFVGEVCGKAEEAVDFYMSVFRDSRKEEPMRYEAGEEPDKAGTVKHVAFTLENMDFAAMDSARDHDFAFNEAISFVINCQGQEEIDYYWEKLSADPSAEQCGWLKDKYGVSWQVVPVEMDEMMEKASKEQMARLTESFLKMKKFDLAELQKAYEGKS